ncbi:hypothetical protein [Brevundimonas sp. PWP3-1b1]|jgi:hypothetical protein|uniref:hypothetical protein n=1 Tax=unclassified Brevundimonas TaxID=2622653 RepID=UPI003CEE71EF
MGQSISFDLSYSVWLNNYQTAEEIGEDDSGAFAALEELEKFILRHVPRCLNEAVSVLNVVKVNVEMGGRSDNLDVAALANIMKALTSLAAVSDSPKSVVTSSAAA